ncbi:membrane protein insertion efficiency factor YidD [Schaalia suimastitidis]|uniref:membrane protein insertion efficiency factor YidD n=1 Tax=Schaalia suimastitidis TaxID=121163 RepID=UPI000425FEAC|nr:membrane protein insertion efficiency factor YidD [Schaalia suimastitidis]
MASSIFGRILALPIQAYQRFISPMIAPRCRYAPTCSAYAVESLSVHGPIKGTILAVWRLLRCNPWSHGGVDYVPQRGSWKAPEWIPPEDWVGHLHLDPPFPMGMERIDDWNDGTEPNAPTCPEHSGMTQNAPSVHQP